MAEEPPRNIVEAFASALYRTIDAPVTWFREKVVVPNRQQYPWYHRQYRRVPTVDNCYTDDPVCEFEATYQYKRDKLVDNEILSILRQRMEACAMYESPDVERCSDVIQQYKLAEENWFTKHGDLGAYYDAPKAYMKQKHRMIWERRHGPVGTGMKVDDNGFPIEKPKEEGFE
ncbi:NADH dehydrogenase (ubiquinone) PDSW subunit [Arctopsyche grandis]|uniref:NADH dehydrogenase (ubiquinone) PDSW subunit n=1 Tax=Arctopsyche grandis TaxID=121162 RepID=UPI00406D6383